MIRPVFFSAFLLLVCSSASFAQYQTASVQAALKQLQQDPDLRSANWSLCVRDAQSGEVVIAHEEHRALPTASTMKAITTATALARLGPDFQFTTSLEVDGPIEEGVLKGNLFVHGSGDPTLGSDRFGSAFELEVLMKAWVTLIQEAGIQRIEGKVIGDGTAFDTQLTPGNWGWEDMGNYYGVGAAGLNVHENLYYLDFIPGTYHGGSTRITGTRPDVPGLSFVNEVTTGSRTSGDNAYIFGAPYTYQRYVRGTIPAGRQPFTIKGSIPDPVLFCAQHFLQALQKAGISAQEASSMRLEALARQAPQGQRTVLHRHLSPPLHALIEPLNMKSINLYAEALCKQLAVDDGKLGSTREGTECMEDYWSAQGIDTRGMAIRDGSGLSPNNAMSTAQMSHILAKAHTASYAEALYTSLPVAGRSGSLSSMLRGTRAEGNLRAKSGYIGGVRSYTGYVDTPSGKRLSFAVISHNYSCSVGHMRRKLESLMASLATIN